MNIITKARRFAIHAHGAINQRRKYTFEPYIFHPIAVAKLVASITDDAHMIAAAFLHDVVEDTPFSNTDILKHFGEDIAQLVSDLTDVSQPQDGNRATRKAIDRAHTAGASLRAKTIKLADLIDNTRSITQHDMAFAKVYLAEKAKLLTVLSDGHPALFTQAEHLLQLGQQRLQD